VTFSSRRSMNAALPAPAPDPFGLWRIPDSPGSGGISFAAPGMESAPGGETPGAVWSLDLSTAPQELERRAEQVQAIDAGLEMAEARLDAFLARREAQQVGGAGTGAVSFGLPGESAEASLAFFLDDLEPGLEAESFGLGDTIGRLAGQARERISRLPGAAIPWNDLRGSLESLLDSANRQLLHLAWVDTILEDRLAARTTVTWDGDMTTIWRPGLLPDQTQAHGRSLEVALASRAANLHTVLTVSRLAGKIALAAATPLGPLQALALGWQFVQEVIMPLLAKEK
jgi:hypothetical protein